MSNQTEAEQAMTDQPAPDVVELAARAMCNAAWASVNEDWSLASDEQQDEFRLMARAALEAAHPALVEEIRRLRAQMIGVRTICERDSSESAKLADIYRHVCQSLALSPATAGDSHDR